MGDACGSEGDGGGGGAFTVHEHAILPGRRRRQLALQRRVGVQVVAADVPFPLPLADGFGRPAGGPVGPPYLGRGRCRSAEYSGDWP